MTRCLLLAAALMALSGVSGSADANALAAPCQVDLDGQVGDGGRYGGGGVATGCQSEPGTGARDNGTRSERTVRSDPNACPDTPDARLVIVRVFDSSGVLLSTDRYCEGPLAPGEPAPPAVPAPERVLEEAPLPLPEVHTSPPNRGLVGFETWLWWGADTTLEPITVTLAGWTATVTPTLEQVTWDLGNGHTITGDGPGSEDHPSATYVYRQRCDCTITVTATWGGTVTLTHPLAPAPITQTATGVPFTATLDYPVVERQAVIIR